MVKIGPSFKIQEKSDSTQITNLSKIKVIDVKQSESQDTVTLSTNGTKKFAEIKAEMNKNVPNQTATIKEKEMAIRYINELLNCADITPELKDYWQNKKDIIEMEIQTIKNEDSVNKEADSNTIAKEFNNFTNTYWNKKPNFQNVPDRVEYYESYYNMYLSFCDRMLACDNLSDNMKTEWTRMRQNALFDLNNHKIDLNNYYKENDKKTEKFDDVFNEMKKQVPNRTSTKSEKLLAISYINRMLSCNDIPNADYWLNKKTEIENELSRM